MDPADEWFRKYQTTYESPNIDYLVEALIIDHKVVASGLSFVRRFLMPEGQPDEQKKLLELFFTAGARHLLDVLLADSKFKEGLTPRNLDVLLAVAVELSHHKNVMPVGKLKKSML
jgi:hypothetical protein